MGRVKRQKLPRRPGLKLKKLQPQLPRPRKKLRRSWREKQKRALQPPPSWLLVKLQSSKERRKKLRGFAKKRLSASDLQRKPKRRRKKLRGKRKKKLSARNVKRKRPKGRRKKQLSARNA